MLNKELLMVGKEVPTPKPIPIFMRVRYLPPIYGWDWTVSGINKLPAWYIEGNRYTLSSLYYDRLDMRTCTSLGGVPNKFSSWPLQISIYDISQTFLFVESQKNVCLPNDIFDFENQVDQLVYLTFDPPPRQLPRSANTRTDLEYYVEGEVPWEAQDAE